MTTVKTTSSFIFNNCVVAPRSPRLTSLRSSLLALINLKHDVTSTIIHLIGFVFNNCFSANRSPRLTRLRSFLTSLLLLTSLFASSPSLAFDEDIPITTDNRIKTYIYNPNEVYLLVLHFGYQSHLEFAKGEEIQTISLGDSYAWKITPLANRLFIKPLEKNMRTNMTIITNKRTYQFDIVSQELEMGEEKDLVYVIRFYYPKKNSISN